MTRKSKTQQTKRVSSLKQTSARNWLREEYGMYLVTYKKNEPEYRKIANHGVMLKTVLFVINSHDIEVWYALSYRTNNGDVDVRIRHEALADERVFLNEAPPGFALTFGSGAFSLFRECLMSDLENAEREAIITVLGWYLWGNAPVFVHAGGVIRSVDGSSGNRPTSSFGTRKTHPLIDIDQLCSEVPILAGKHRPITKLHVQVPAQFRKYRLNVPTSKAEAKRAMRAVIELLEIGDPNVTYLSVSAVFMTAIREPRFALFLYGETGSLKTAFALLLLAFFVADPQESDCASFKSTTTALNARFAASGNVPVIVDDYIQMPGTRQPGEEVKKADNLIRAIVNGNGKERSFGNGALRPTDRPRGIPIITGEELPTGLESLKTRTINIPVDKSSFEQALSGPRPNMFDCVQEHARNGLLTVAMGGFVSHVVENYSDYQSYFDDPQHHFALNEKLHRRLPDAACNVLSGSALLLNYAREVEAITEEEFDKHAKSVIDAVDSMLQRAYTESLQDRPTEAFAQLLQSSLASLRCHIEVSNIDDYVRANDSIPMALLGYRESEEPVTSPVDEEGSKGVERPSTVDLPSTTLDDARKTTRTVYRPQGPRIGWIENQCIDLIPEAALAEANSMASRSGASRLPTTRTFGKRLVSNAWIAEQSADRNTLKVRQGTVVIDVWRIHAFRLFEYPLVWGAFDVESYKEMSNAERLAASLQRRELAIQDLRERLVTFQSDKLLNPCLSESDRRAILTPDHIPFEGGNDIVRNHSRFNPAPPIARRHDCLDDPRGDGLLA